MLYKYKLRGFAITIITVFIILFCYSCSTDNEIDLINPDNPAYAYLKVFKVMVGDMKELNFLNINRIKYVGVDTMNILHENPSDIKKLIENYAKKYHASIIWDKKRHECDYDFYKNGWLIIFEDIELTENKLETHATWMGAVALASATAAYTVERENGEWTITDWRMIRVS